MIAARTWEIVRHESRWPALPGGYSNYMPYRLLNRESIATGLRRIAGEQATRGLASLSEALAQPAARPVPDTADAWDDAVHDTRKRCKKIRAVARLCRDALGEDYKPINVAFRDTARLLAAPRDAATLVQSVDMLDRLDGDDLIPAATLAHLREALLLRYAGEREEAVAEGRLEQARGSLESAAEGIEQWPLEEDLQAVALHRSIKRVYARGRAGLNQAAETLDQDPHPSTELWHDWRKRAKYLWYHMRLIGPVWPDLVDIVACDLNALTDDLGDEHDLAVLIDTVEVAGLLDPGACAQLVGAAAAQRHVLRHEAVINARRLYVEEPDAFAHRMTGYLRLR